MRTWFVGIGIGIGVAVSMLGGCVTVDEQAPWPQDSDLGGQLSEAAAQPHELRPVAELTDFEWTTLTIIDEGTPHDEALELLGYEAFSDNYYFGVGLAVFCGDGQVVMETYVITEALGGPIPRTVSHDALIGAGRLEDDWGSAEPVPDCVGERTSPEPSA